MKQGFLNRLHLTTNAARSTLIPSQKPNTWSKIAQIELEYLVWSFWQGCTVCTCVILQAARARR